MAGMNYLGELLTSPMFKRVVRRIDKQSIYKDSALEEVFKSKKRLEFEHKMAEDLINNPNYRRIS